MTPKEKTELVQELSKIIDRNPGMSSFQLANIMVKEVVEPYVEISEAIWQRMLFSHRSTRGSPH
jgi:hypothetical protein